MMAGEFDFEPMSKGDIDAHCVRWIFEDSTRMARELRAWREKGRALETAKGRRDYARDIYRGCPADLYEERRAQYNDACAAVVSAEAEFRALVAHVEGGEE